MSDQNEKLLLIKRKASHFWVLTKNKASHFWRITKNKTGHTWAIAKNKAGQFWASTVTAFNGWDWERTWKITQEVLSVMWKVLKWISKAWWWCFIIALWMIGIFIYIMQVIDAIYEGRSLPRFTPPKRPRRRFDANKFREDLKNYELENFLDDFSEELEELKNLSNSGKLNSDQDKVVRKIRKFDGSRYNDRLGDLFSEDEIEELLLIILILLGVEFD